MEFIYSLHIHLNSGQVSNNIFWMMVEPQNVPRVLRNFEFQVFLTNSRTKTIITWKKIWLALLFLNSFDKLTQTLINCEIGIFLEFLISTLTPQKGWYENCPDLYIKTYSFFFEEIKSEDCKRFCVSWTKIEWLRYDTFVQFCLILLVY